MASYYIVKYGDGGCRTANKTTTVTLNRTELDSLRTLCAGNRDKALKNLNRLSIIIAGAGLGFWAGMGVSVAMNEFSGAISKCLSQSPEKINKLLLSKNSYYKVKLNLRCVNKGRNGHYLSLNTLDPIN